MDKHITNSEGTGLVGVYKFTKAKLETPEQWALYNTILGLIDRGKEYLHLVRKLNMLCNAQVIEKRNLIPTAGRTAIANALTSTSPNPSTLRINKSALGTSSTAPANANTTLGTETFRKDIASQTNANNVAYFTAFYTAAEVSGTFEEYGLFIEGTASADTGTLFSRTTQQIIKTAVETLTIDYTVTIS